MMENKSFKHEERCVRTVSRCYDTYLTRLHNFLTRYAALIPMVPDCPQIKSFRREEATVPV